MARHVLTDLLEVVLQGRRHGIRVAGHERRQDRAMQTSRPAWIRPWRDEREVRPRERLQRAPDPGERGIVREVDDPAVER